MYIYVGNFVEPGQEEYVTKVAKAPRVVSIDSFQKMLLSGFEKSNKKFDYLINAPEIGSYPKRSLSIKVPSSDFEFYGMKGRNVSFLNISYFKRYSIAHSILEELDNVISNVHISEVVVIVVCTLYYQYIKPVVDIKKKYNKKNIIICPIALDLPDFLGDKSVKAKPSNSVRRIYSLLTEADCFIILTRFMPDKLGKDKQYFLMEGVYGAKDIGIKNISKRPKTILYTGTFDGRYGIKNLVNAFMAVKDPEASLLLCGDGTEREYVENRAKEDSRIIYYGQVKQERVFEMQREASLLINPRKPEGEYTKYSFPSKTMEYMASGTPTLMYRLPGMPEEYEPYVALFKNSSDEEMTRVMEEWLNKPQEELDAFGAKAREFIINNKTADKQVARFMNFIKETYGE